MKNKILLIGFFCIAALLLENCAGGGIKIPLIDKPLCYNFDLAANVTVFQGYPPFASKKYVCDNGSWKSVSDDYKCVPSICDGQIANPNNVCGWEETDIVQNPRNASYYMVKSYNPNPGFNCLYKATCKVGKIEYDTLSKLLYVQGDCSKNSSHANSTPPLIKPGDELKRDIGDFGNDPFLDPVIRNPSKSCKPTSAYRLENANCSVATSSNDYACLQSCLDEIYIDNSGATNSDKSKNSRKFEVGFNIEDFVRKEYVIAVIKDYNGAKGITKTSAGVCYFGSKLRLLDCNRWNSNLSTKKASGIWTADMDIPAGLKDGDKLYTVILQKNTLNTYDPVGTYCYFTARTIEDKLSPPLTQRTLNLLYFKSTSTTFNSDITSYNYYPANSVFGGGFKKYFEYIWQYQLHTSSINYSTNTLPENLVDENGNIVLWEKDIPTYSYTNLEGKIVKERKVFDASLHDTVPSKITAQIFRDSLLGKWKNRMDRYNRLLSGKTDNTPKIGTDNNINWSEVKLPILNDPKGSRDYANLIGIVVINGFSIVNVTEVKFPDLTTQLNNYINKFKTENQLTQLAPSGSTRGEPSKYSPICIIYSSMHERIFSTTEEEFQGTIIATALHEIGHAWYLTKSTSLETYVGDQGDNYYLQHVAYNYMNKRDDCKGDYYCLMKPRREVKIPDLVDQREFSKNQLINMSFSRGIMERLRNVFSATY
ncbi:MAG: hypothetical protein H7329_20310 [Opitutaceae bacterium]|nr:hypothetical protein [Cytophagales bacterium]